MKKILLALSALCLILLFACSTHVGPQPITDLSNYESSSCELDWYEVNANPSFSAREHPILVDHNGELWLFHGDYTDIWKTTDGISWTYVSEGAFGHIAIIPINNVDSQVISYNNQLWAFPYYGGLSISSDGINWTIYSTLGGRAIVFNGKVWTVSSTTTDCIIRNTTNGTTWYQVASVPGMKDKEDFQLTVYDGKLWLIGGQKISAFVQCSDIWNTSDGITWTKVTDTMQIETGVTGYYRDSILGSAFLRLVTFNNKMWLVASEDETWWSQDGITWYMCNDNTFGYGSEWGGVGVYDNSIWRIGGLAQDDPDNRSTNSVWRTR